jgi:pyridoxine 5-phosphate synthase
MRLSVNVDHVATLREARGGVEPDPVHAAILAEIAGAHGVVSHLREDRRHINDRDVRALRDILTKKFDLEMAASPDVISLALEVVPDMVTIVPEKREELTTEGGLDVADREQYLSELVDTFHDRGIQVSLFVEPESLQIDACARTGADMVELHTGQYSHARSRGAAAAQLARLHSAAELATENGLIVKAGHGLNLQNVGPLLDIPFIEEVSIGHALIGHAVLVGMDRAVRDYLALLQAVPGTV